MDVSLFIIIVFEYGEWTLVLIGEVPKMLGCYRWLSGSVGGLILWAYWEIVTIHYSMLDLLMSKE